ncbi:hypothetical protein VOLCADRAFT_96917 [Volvox carteri f. nagariensis]|uniref:Peptidase M11 gametolysin domain-containing protein n=1 Tax=Volvox carteri f. nagariensis TaxID=3068 RepID=D8UBB6_VOLCA|nr:uncharacterized protein VOLCADRAFT_96917 [Volvox carteri f. nagariensis]EFJ42975.1 hypothetical protein VOLCADRAFT_96917 [Volvox carteri f. nagariensis]|eukprot:XP_002956015.1 hypothetical protein VOLCADRAFT_96917 [Volvox carteri f. nagariensis]
MVARPRGLAPIALYGLFFGGLCLLVYNNGVDASAAAAAGGQQRTLLGTSATRQVLKLYRPPRSPEAPSTPGAPADAPPTPAATLEGYIKVQMGDDVNGRDLMYVFLQKSDESLTELLMDKEEAFQHVNQRVRVSILPDNDLGSSDKNSGSEATAAAGDFTQQLSQANNRRRLLQRSSAVRAKVVEVLSSPTDSADLQDGAKDFPVDGRQPIINVTGVVFLLSFCGLRNMYDVNSFRKIWVNEPGTPADTFTMQNYMSYCSQGMTQMSVASQNIFEVELPCTGTMANGVLVYSFNMSSTCGPIEQYAWYKLSADKVRDTLGFNASAFKQQVFILPPKSRCSLSWGGLADVGCTRNFFCRSYIASSNDLRVMMHEMSHNFGLHHSGEGGFEYGDESCVMGTGDSCFNAPNAWRLGWVDTVPGGDLDGSTLEVGRPRRFTLPPQTKARQAIVRIYPDWKIGQAAPLWPRALYGGESVQSIYLGFRVKVPPFERILDRDSNAVTVHVYGANRSASGFGLALKVRTLRPGGYEEFRDDAWSGIVVRLISMNPDVNAIVSVCRSTGAKESQGGNSCEDGIDNDCDGKVTAATKALVSPAATKAAATSATTPRMASREGPTPTASEPTRRSTFDTANTLSTALASPAPALAAATFAAAATLASTAAAPACCASKASPCKGRASTTQQE